MVGREGLITDEDLQDIERKQDIVSKLNACGAFDIRGGSFTCHFDGDGQLRRIDRADSLYRS